MHNIIFGWFLQFFFFKKIEIGRNVKFNYGMRLAQKSNKFFLKLIIELTTIIKGWQISILMNSFGNQYSQLINESAYLLRIKAITVIRGQCKIAGFRGNPVEPEAKNGLILNTEYNLGAAFIEQQVDALQVAAFF